LTQGADLIIIVKKDIVKARMGQGHICFQQGERAVTESSF